MGGRLLEGPTMVGSTSDWKAELGRWLKPFLDRLGHKARRQMCPLYVSGLIGPGDRKSIAPIAERLALGDYDQLHHFVAAGVWDATPVETELLVHLSRLCPPCATQFSNSSRHHRRSDARIAENGFATSGGVSKSAKVVLGSRLIKSTIQERRPDRQRPSSFVPVCRSALRCA